MIAREATVPVAVDNRTGQLEAAAAGADDELVELLEEPEESEEPDEDEDVEVEVDDEESELAELELVVELFDASRLSVR